MWVHHSAASALWASFLCEMRVITLFVPFCLECCDVEGSDVINSTWEQKNHGVKEPG